MTEPSKEALELAQMIALACGGATERRSEFASAIDAFAQRAVEAEREACALLMLEEHGHDVTTWEIAARFIRSRGEA